MTKKYVSTKTYRQIAPVAYRQWKTDTACKIWHGYALSFHFEFETDDLDARNWVVDYGSLRPLKDMIEDLMDHKFLLAQDDPEFEFVMEAQRRGLCKVTVVERTGCEGLADFLYEYINTVWLKDYGYSPRVWCSKVEVRETDSNMAYRQGHAEDREFE